MTMIDGRCRDKINWVSWLMVIFVIYQIALWIAWVIPSRYYVGFDESWHLEISQQLYYSLVDYGVLGLLWKFIHAMQAKPPLVSLLPVPMYLLFGNQAWIGTAVNLIWLVLLNVYLFRLVRHFWGEGPAFIACVSLQTMPLFPGLSRMVMAEYGTTALVIMFMYYLFAGKPSLRRAVYLGIVLGLGQLQKVLFFSYVFFPLLWSIYAEFKENQGRAKYCLSLWLLTAGITLWLSAPWYITNLRPVWEYTFRSTYADTANVYRYGACLDDLKALWSYINVFMNGGITAYQAVLLGTCWIGVLIWHRGKKKEKISRITVGIILWFVAPFLIFLPSLYRNFKFMMPFFAPFSIALGVLMWCLVKGSRWRWPVIAALLIWPNFSILYASFPLGHLNQPYHLLKIGPFEFLPQSGYLGFPRLGHWPYEEILKYVASDGACFKASTGKKPSIGMACDMSEFNRSTMLYVQQKLRLPIEVYWAPLGGRADPKYDLEAALALTSQQDYVLFRVPNPTDPDFTNKFNDQIRESIRRRELPFRLIKEYPLPDGAKALLYRRET